MEKSKERQELEEAIQKLRELRKPKVSKEIIDAIIDRIKKDDQPDEKVARPTQPDETHANL